MSSGGVVTVVFRCYAKSKRLVGDPDVISRGLMYGSEQHDVTKDVAKTAKKAYEDAINTGENDRKAIKRSINGALFRYFNKKLNREPMIIPIIIEV
jgi:ribonuclease J